MINTNVFFDFLELVSNQEGRKERQGGDSPAVVVIRGAGMNGAGTTTNHRYGSARDKEGAFSFLFSSEGFLWIVVDF
jgi:hypothetical protein